VDNLSAELSIDHSSLMEDFMSKKETLENKLDYVKPTVLDIGEVTYLGGATCSSGDGDDCPTGPSGDTGFTICTNGTNAMSDCDKGSLEGTPNPT
jgi:hypothetical protein